MDEFVIPYRISYRKVKYARLEFRMGDLLVIVPHGYNYKNLLDKKKKWIGKKEKFIREVLSSHRDKKLEERPDSEFTEIVFAEANKFSRELNAKIDKISFRKMKSKWASINTLNSITINKIMKYLPDYLISYIVFHEVAHTIERNHGKGFWGLIKKQYSNYQDFERELYYYWFLIKRDVQEN